jgi:hypothetical protein
MLFASWYDSLNSQHSLHNVLCPIVGFFNGASTVALLGCDELLVTTKNNVAHISRALVPHVERHVDQRVVPEIVEEKS